MQSKQLYIGRKIILEGGSEEVVRESDHCIFEDFVYIYIYICLFKYGHALCMINSLSWEGTTLVMHIHATLCA